ncbi:hypothetical protein SmB9_31170 [Sphingosinicella microcystinivorans]|uniref:Uncharacterized protein n=1 Tax=Sphingosinicella microcystinivorans TaxID=335406 RepID=A0AAD1G277_SPHMI|nr:hypothetical protein SmB9_31170 [Sphingosinicella microcystinivorans]
MEDANGTGIRIIGPEAVGADEFGKPVRMVRIRALHGAHFVQNNGNARARELPGGFRTGEAAAYDVDRCLHARGDMGKGCSRPVLHGRPLFAMSLAECRAAS